MKNFLQKVIASPQLFIPLSLISSPFRLQLEFGIEDLKVSVETLMHLSGKFLL